MKQNKIIKNRVCPAGMSIVELITVIAIIGVISGASFVSFTFVTGNRLEADTRKIVSDLCWARQMSVAQHRNYIIDFDTANERYIIYRDSIAVNNEVKKQDLSVDLVSVAPLPAQVTFSFPLGTSAARQVNLSAVGRTRQVVVFADTGYVKFQ